MAFNRDAAWDHAERDFPDATQEQLEAVVRANEALYRATLVAAGMPDDDDNIIEDTPTGQNCDDWGTGEGRYHGRI